MCTQGQAHLPTQNAVSRPSRTAPPNPAKSPPVQGDRCREVAPILSAAAFSWTRPRFAATRGGLARRGAFPRLTLTPSSHPADLGADPGAGQLGRGAPSRLLPSRLREPGVWQPLPPRAAHPAAQVSPQPRAMAALRLLLVVAGKAPCAGAQGVLLRISWPQQGASGASSLGLGETKPREMNEAHSWLKNPCEALKSEQLKGLESRSGSAWNGKNQLPQVGSACLCSKTPGAGSRGPAHRGFWHQRPSLTCCCRVAEPPGVSGPAGCRLSPSSTAWAVGSGLAGKQVPVPWPPLSQPPRTKALLAVQAGCDIW